MKIIHKDLKKGEIKVKVENLDDIWYLSHIVEKGDLVKGYTFRKIKIGKEGERKVRVAKKRVFLTLEVEKTEYEAEILKASGIVKGGPEDVPRGSHHTLNIEENNVLTIIKQKWLRYQIDKLKEASAVKAPDILICILDREEAIFALLKRKGHEVLSSIKGEVEKKEVEVRVKGSFYNEVIKLLKEYSDRYKVRNIILASPAFWKEDAMKQIKDEELKKKIVLATCSSVDKSAINEVLKRTEIKEVLKQDRISREMKLVENLLAEISKKGNSAYGIDEVNMAAEAGAVKELLITDSFIQKMRNEQKYKKIDELMKTVDKMKGEIHIISGEHEGGKKLDGLGGIGGLLRFRIS
ncbi:mRNA surveillance protein pelota [Candidatus Woesearchaeota archaeon]|nr:mRNA surveillance protein pelota [Candidatus Woesearchaeota archaeon]